MSVQLVLGGSGTGKTHRILKDMVEDSYKNPDKKYFAIVPEQFTLETQRRIVMLGDRRGTMNINIISFERLATRLFEEAGMDSFKILNDTGKCLIIKKIIEENKEKLPVCAKKAKLPGFVEEMKSVISEFYQYGIDGERIDDILLRSQSKPVLAEKFEEIALIMEKLKEYVKDEYMMNEELLTRACEQIPYSKLIKGSVMVFDEYTGFSPVQYEMLRALCKYAKKIQICLTIRSTEMMAHSAENDIFHLTKKTVAHIEQMCADCGVEMENPLIFTENVRQRDFTMLNALEQNLFRYPVVTFDKEESRPSVVVCSAANQLDEAEFVATKIRELIRTQGIRFRDLAVLSPDLEGYRRALEEAFDTHEVSYFMDYKRSMLSNPMVEGIRAAMEVVLENFQYESVFRYLRSGMSRLEREMTDRLENHVIQRGIRGYARWSGEDFKTEDEDILAAKSLVMDELSDLYEALKPARGKKPVSVARQMEGICRFCEKMRMDERIKEMTAMFQEKGMLAKVKEYEQAYEKVMQVFNQTVHLLGEEALVLSELSQILDAGFDEIKVGVIPPSMDAVAVGDIERTRLRDIQVLFLVGANDGLIPKQGGKSGILSQNERGYLEELGVELSPTAREDIFIQKYYLYMMLTKPSKQLFLSYKRVNNDGKSVRPSYLIGQLKRMYPRLQVVDCDVIKERETFAAVTNKKTAYSKIAEEMFDQVHGRRDAGFLELYRELLRRDVKMDALLSASEYQYKNERLKKEIAKLLYGENLFNSVSRLESFSDCAYRHFIEYGLALVKRNEYQVEAADIGNILHEVLNQFSRTLRKEKLSWKTIEDTKRDAIIEQCVAKMHEQYSDSVMCDNCRNQAMFERVLTMAKKTILILQKQVRKGKFEPHAFEMRFKSEEGIPELSYDYGDSRMEIHGVIDRTDYYECGDDIYVKVIDYKSNNKKFIISDAINRRQLQLVVYMEAAMTIAGKNNKGKKIHPAGILYYNVDEPEIKGSEVGVNSEKDMCASEDKIEKAYLKSLCPNGIIDEQEMVLAAFDEEYEENKAEHKSLVAPFSTLKAGNLAKSSQTLSEEDMTCLMKFVHDEVGVLGKEILEGVIQVKPAAKLKSGGGIDETTLPCRYCDCRGICGYDSNIPGYEVRELQDMKPDKAMEYIKNKQNVQHSSLEDTFGSQEVGEEKEL